ncbi:hypothetical protein [Dankookia sp. P2]|uniref:hypothetical protein n=1 Tax=Dankookia sp. P2 TaxID=3423955 RepID=UPI003D67A763
MDDNAVHQGAGRLQGIGRIAGVQGVIVCRDPLAVDLGQVRVQRWDGMRRGSHQPRQFRLSGLKTIQLRPKASRREPVSNRIDQVGDLPFDTAQLAAVTFGGRPGLGRHPVPFGGELGDEVGHQLGLHQLPPERLADPLLQWCPADGVAVAAGALVGMAAPQVARRGRRSCRRPPCPRGGAAAAAAASRPACRMGQQEICVGRQAGLHALPERIVDDL